LRESAGVHGSPQRVLIPDSVLRIRSKQSRLFLLAQSEAVALDHERVTVMEQPVENRRGEDVVAEDGAPLARASSVSQDAIGDRELEHFRIDVASQPCPKCLQYVGGIQRIRVNAGEWP